MNDLRTIENMKEWMKFNYGLGWYDEFWRGVEAFRYVGMITEEEYKELQAHEEYLKKLFNKEITEILAGAN
jgi:hypothetical protein